MSHFNKEFQKLKISIENNEFTIYSGIYSINKDYIVDNFIKNISDEYNCIILDFTIWNLNRLFSLGEIKQFIQQSIKKKEKNIIIIKEITNCESWVNVIDLIISEFKLKLLGITSIDLSTLLTFCKNKKFRYIYNDVSYVPPTYKEYFEVNVSSNHDAYIDYGSILLENTFSFNEDILKKISEFNSIRLFSIFLVTTKVRNHFHLKAFIMFLIKNMDMKLTLDYIKNNIAKNDYISMSNIKTFWRYIHLLQALYVLVPIRTYSIDRKNTKFNSRYICVDHALYYGIQSENKYFLIIRNFIINEFLKNSIEVLILEEDGDEKGFIVKKNMDKKWIFFYDKNSKIIKMCMKKEKIYSVSCFEIKKNISKHEIIDLMKITSKLINSN